nr:UvrD-helicase domain-containing protein [Streptomyces sp. TLI_235]
MWTWRCTTFPSSAAPKTPTSTGPWPGPLPLARLVWTDATDPNGRAIRFEHDHYLKMWQLTQPRLPGNYLLLDEAQDTNPVLESVVQAQRGHAQLVLVGDSAQQIYAWRGARDIMAHSPGTQLRLTQSFRFGPALAEEANRWLEAADAPLRLTGHAGTDTRIGPLGHSEAVLCRTNAGALTDAMRHLAQAWLVAIAGGGAELRSLALAARDLTAGRGTAHHELFLFKTWEAPRDYAHEDPAGRDLQPWVRLVDDLGPDTVLALLARIGPEHPAGVTVSTAHRAKGREWSTVRIGDDFPQPDTEHDGRPVPPPPRGGTPRLRRRHPSPPPPRSRQPRVDPPAHMCRSSAARRSPTARWGRDRSRHDAARRA